MVGTTWSKLLMYSMCFSFRSGVDSLLDITKKEQMSTWIVDLKFCAQKLCPISLKNERYLWNTVEYTTCMGQTTMDKMPLKDKVQKYEIWVTLVVIRVYQLSTSLSDNLDTQSVADVEIVYIDHSPETSHSTATSLATNKIISSYFCDQIYWVSHMHVNSAFFSHNLTLMNWSSPAGCCRPQSRVQPKSKNQLNKQRREREIISNIWRTMRVRECRQHERQRDTHWS